MRIGDVLIVMSENWARIIDPLSSYKEKVPLEMEFLLFLVSVYTSLRLMIQLSSCLLDYAMILDAFRLQTSPTAFPMANSGQGSSLYSATRGQRYISTLYPV